MYKKISRRKYKVYDSLRMAIKRAKIKNPGKTATLLLETFVERNGFLKADMAIEAGVCKKGEFVYWRESLQKKGFIFFQYDGPGTSHRPGPRLNEYLNKEKISSCELVTRSDLSIFPKKSDVPSREEFDALKKVVQDLINEIDPPFTEEKMEARIELVKH